jgi:hypothetical protein
MIEEFIKKVRKKYLGQKDVDESFRSGMDAMFIGQSDNPDGRSYVSSEDKQEIKDMVFKAIDKMGHDWLLDEEPFTDAIDEIGYKAETKEQFSSGIKDYLNGKEFSDQYYMDDFGDEVFGDLSEKKKKKKKKKKKDDRCTRIAKRKYDAWPSAYASGAVVQCRRGKIWKGLKEDATDEQLFENTEFEQHEALQEDESLRKWFKRKGAPGKTGGWVDCNTCRKDKKTGRKKCKACGRSKGEKRAKYPRCRPTPSQCKGYKRRGSNLQKEGEFKHDFDSPERIMRKFKDVLLSGAPRSAATGGFDPSKLSREEFYFFAADTAVPFGLPWRVRDEMIDDLIDAAKKENFPIMKLQKEEVIEEIEYSYIPAHDATYDDGNTIDFMLEFWDDVVIEAEYRGRKVKLNKPMRGDVKKFKVYVKDPKTGNIKKVNFGDPKMRIRKSNPKARKSFRARHNCDNPGPKTKARYWSCRKW